MEDGTKETKRNPRKLDKLASLVDLPIRLDANHQRDTYPAVQDQIFFWDLPPTSNIGWPPAGQVQNGGTVLRSNLLKGNRPRLGQLPPLNQWRQKCFGDDFKKSPEVSLQNSDKQATNCELAGDTVQLLSQ